jgi:hypothetical protein
MARRPFGPDPDLVLCARLAGTASRYADATGSDAYPAAVAELRELAGGRADLLAQEAGLIWGSRSDGIPLDWPHFERVVLYLIDAGADPEEVPGWFAEGRRRALRPWHRDRWTR